MEKGKRNGRRRYMSSSRAAEKIRGFYEKGGKMGMKLRDNMEHFVYFAL